MLGSCLRARLAWPRRLARAAAAVVAPCVYALPHRVDGGQRQVGALDDPRRVGHHLARREGALSDAPLDHRGTDLPLLGRLGPREPSVPLRAIREAIVLPDTRHTVRPPRFARPRPIAQAIERGRNGQVAADCGELADDRKDIVLGRPAMLPRRIAGHPHLGVHPAMPV